MDINEVIASYLTSLGYSFKHELNPLTQDCSFDMSTGSEREIFSTVRGFYNTVDTHGNHKKQEYEVEISVELKAPYTLSIVGLVAHTYNKKIDTMKTQTHSFHWKEDTSRMAKEGIKMYWANKKGGLANSEIAKQVVTEMVAAMKQLEQNIK